MVQLYTKNSLNLKLALTIMCQSKNFALPIPCIHHTLDLPQLTATNMSRKYYGNTSQASAHGNTQTSTSGMSSGRGGKGISSATTTQPAAAAAATTTAAAAADAHPHQLRPGIHYQHEPLDGRRIWKHCSNASLLRWRICTRANVHIVWQAPEPTNGATSSVYSVGRSQSEHTTPKTYTF